MANQTQIMQIKSLFFLIAIIGFLPLSAHLQAQQPKNRTIKLKKISTFYPQKYSPASDAQIINLEAPSPGGDSYRSFLMRQKAKSAKKHPKTGVTPTRKKEEEKAPDLILEKGFGKYRYRAVLDRNEFLTGGNPLDNTIAVSDDGIMLSSVNSYLWAFDVNGDSTLKGNNGDSWQINFKAFAGDSISPSGENTFPFDPRLIYDPVHKRFIFMFLDGRGPDDSQIVIGVSSSTNPQDPWTVFAVTGNPRNVNEWTDFPAAAISESELFFTVNQIEAGVSWQEGFRGSLIWQIDLKALYNGDSEPEALLWDDIKHDGKYIRNLLPVKHAEAPEGDNMYFLSNRNFDIQNDTLFVLEVTNTAGSAAAALNIEAVTLDIPYGLAPNGRQEDTPEGEEDSLGLQTNDARWLGGVRYKDQIHFTGNTKNFETGLSAIYHGIIENLNGERTYGGRVIGSDSLDYGYPDIAYTGTSDCDNTFIIAFDHTSPTFHPGVSAIYYNHNTGLYSEPKTLKAGENYIQQLQGAYERWGDYIGIQRIYNEPGKVWIGGFYGRENFRSNTWFSKVAVSPQETSDPVAVVDTVSNTAGNFCEVNLTASVSGGIEPYSYFWNGEPGDSSFTFNGCNGEFELKIIDDYNCEITLSGDFAANEPVQVSSSNVFPNPANVQFTVDFELQEDDNVDAFLVDMTGKVVQRLIKTRTFKGKNRLLFDTRSLSQGVYELIIKSSQTGEIILSERIVKVN